MDIAIPEDMLWLIARNLVGKIAAKLAIMLFRRKMEKEPKEKNIVEKELSFLIEFTFRLEDEVNDFCFKD